MTFFELARELAPRVLVGKAQQGGGRGGLLAAFVIVLLAWLCLAVQTAQAVVPAGGTRITAQAHASYRMAEMTQAFTAWSPVVIANVATVEALTLSGPERLRTPPGADVLARYLLTNTGNTSAGYRFALDTTGCIGTNQSLADLRVAVDRNNNGAADPNEFVALGSEALRLSAGRGINVIVLGVAPPVDSGTACVVLTATSMVQSEAASATTTVELTPGASVTLYKTASYSGGVLTRGSSTVDFTVTARNLGTEAALPSPTSGPTATPVLVNGVSTSLVLLRDVLPAGTRYVMGSLRSSFPGATLLYRLPNDPAFNYRTTDDASAVEVAVGLPSLAEQASAAMVFQAQLRPAAAGLPAEVVNVGEISYRAGGAAQSVGSNTVVLPIDDSRLGVALQNVSVVPQANAAGVTDGTAIVTFRARLRNYGADALYNVQVRHLVAGASTTAAFGNWTSADAPAAGQYTVVPGSVRIVSATPSGVSVAPAANYTGQTGGDGLLADGSLLPPGGDVLVEYSLRVNFQGRSSTINTSATAQAARAAGLPSDQNDTSVDGTDPDPAGTGQPQTQASATPVVPPPMLSLTQTVGSPRRVGNGVFEIDYTTVVTNHGAVTASAVRLLENLDCSIRQQTDGAVTDWQLLAPPVAHNGRLTINSGFTGTAPCNDAVDTGSGAPVRASLSLTDGDSGLATGQSERITFTVRVSLKQVSGTRATLSHRVWAVAYDGSSSQATRTVAVTSGTMAFSLLIDPQGIVYDSLTRAPIAGATVRVSRLSCQATPALPITAGEVLNGGSSQFTYHSDGSVSMVTGPDGEYEFFWVSPPVNDLCSYSLSVTPPPGGAYVASTGILPQAGEFAACGAVVPNVGVPQGSDPTTFYTRFVSGLDTSGGPPGVGCELLNNHVPLDPVAAAGVVLFLEKTANKKEIELGDFIDYKLTLTNRSGAAVTGVRFSDTLPAGFSYMSGSAVIDGAPAADPSGGAGPVLEFDRPAHTLADGASLNVVYRAHAGAGAPTAAPAVNRAVAQSGGVSSNQATWSVKVSGGVFADDAFAFGKVWLDCNRNGEQDGENELGIPGVRLFMENGTSVITDGEGRWSLFGLKPVTHVIKLDRRSLPDGAELQAWDNRNAGAADSRFLDVKKGELIKANFPVVNCGSPELLEAVKARRASAKVGTEFDNVAKQRLSPTLSAPSVSGPGTASSGTLGGAAPSTRPLIAMPSGLGGSAAQTPAAAAVSAPVAVPAGNLAPLPATSSVDLETLLPQLDPAPGFIELKDGDTLPSRSVNVRVKGPLGAALRLSVDGTEIADRRVGKKADLASTGTTAWEYIGVALRPGRNRLALTVVDPMGNPRGSAEIHVVAPDDLGEMHLDLGQDTVYADPLTPVELVLRLTDKAGVPVTARTAVTLETDRGSFAGEDLNPNEPGAQVFVEGGVGRVRFTPPAEPGLVRVRTSAGLLAREISFQLMPHLQPMSGIGIVEGVLALGKRNEQALAAGADSPHSAFEAELSGLAREGNNNRASARTAFYFKGAVRGDYLLTAAYDSDKTTRDRLFRDIRPDEYYPVYGDDSARHYDAQSVGKLYVRIDKGQSYLLYGDFTSSASPEVRKLSQVNRSLNGLRHHYETDKARVSSYLSETAGRQQAEEIPANGLSFYFLGGTGDIVANSEQVQVVVRSRTQPQLVLSTRPLARFTDYTFEPLTRRLMLAQPLASVDADLNPQSLRVSYEVDQGGPEYLTGGVDAQFKLGERVQIGVAVNRDENPENNRRGLQAVTVMGRVGENTVVSAEAVRTESDLAGTGNAQRIELRHADGGFKVDAEISRTDANFENPGATITAGRTEALAKAEVPINDTTRLKAELNYSKSEIDAQNAANRNVSVAVQKKFGEQVSVEAGLRDGNVASTTAGSFDYGTVPGASGGGLAPASTGTATSDAVDATTARVRMTVRPSVLPSAEVFGEIEQDVHDSDRRVTALGGAYAVGSNARVYARREFDSSLYETMGEGGSSVNRNTTVVGVDGAYMQGGRLFNEYRMGTQGASNGTGVRNSFSLMEGLQFNVTGEHTRRLSGTAEESTAATFGLDWSQGPWRAGTAMEWRESDTSTAWMFNLAGAYRINSDWSALARSVVSQTEGDSAGARRIARQQLGLAWRPAHTDVVNGLLRYEHRSESIAAGSAGGSFYSLYGTSGAALPGDYNTHLIAGVINVNPSRGNMISGRYAARHQAVSDELGRFSSTTQLLHLRYTRDLSPDWDLGLQAGLMRSRGGALQSSYGLELGYQLAPGLWVSAGHNLRGMNGGELAGQNYTERGWYLRLRFKFDESNFGLGEGARRGVAASPASVPVAVAGPPPIPVAPTLTPVEDDGLSLPLADFLVWGEKLLFSNTGELLPAGRARLDRLGEQLKNAQVRQVRLSVGHGSESAVLDAVWLPRAAAVRTALRKACACAVSLGLDSQAADVARAAAQSDPSIGFTLYVNAAYAARGAATASAQ